MGKIKVISCFGTRPEAVKMCPLVKVLNKCDKIESTVLVTAQHREMLDQVLEVFSIKPDYDLDIMKKNQTLIHITNKVLEGIDRVLKEKKPDILLVHGDTSTSFIGALAAFYNKIPVGHVEAGLRSFNKYSPFPEEMNRKLTGAIADMHFSPTLTNKKNLIKESVNTENIFVTGNTVIDALQTTVKEKYNFQNEILNKVDYFNNKVITLTAHRRENLGKPLEQIFKAIRKIVNNNSQVIIIYPVHLNPKVRNTANKYLSNHERIHLIDPVGIVDMHNLMKKSYMVMTDSGGLQEEAPSLGKPVLVLREETERPEAVKEGTVIVVGVKEDNIYKIASKILNNKNEYDKMANATNPYGDGNASNRIKDAILYRFGIIDKRPIELESRS